ncbi:MAG: hypothetical protein GX033_05520 [Firmicutes bacterium]|nr:hypothetical protein [Bacillota bacterium]
MQWQPEYETTPEAAEELIEKVAKGVQRYGLEVPAVFFMEMSKPLSFTAGSFIHAFSPLLGIYAQNENIFTDVATILSDRTLLEKLICRIEALAKEPDREKV